MDTVAEAPTFRRGRIGPADLSKQDHQYISDYAAHYDIPTNLPVDVIVSKIFKGTREFIPVLPNHTWALNHEGSVVLTERREPPTHPHYLAPTSGPQPNPLGQAFPDLPIDTYSRSPSPASNHDADAIPSPSPRLSLVYPPVGLPFPVDASGNRPEGAQPVPDNWLEQMHAEYEKDHQSLASAIIALAEETKNVSADVVRVLAKISAERADTRHLIDAVRNVCGQEFLDKLMEDVYSTTNFEMNKKRGVSGLTFQSVIYPQGGAREGGKIRSKKFTNDKQIFTAEGGSTALSNQPEDLRASNIESAKATASAIPTFSETLPQLSEQSMKPLKPSTRANKQKLVASPSTQSDLSDNTAHAGTSTIVSKGKKRSHPTHSDDTSEPASPLKRRRKPSVSHEAASSIAPRAGPSTSTAPSTSTRPSTDEPNTQGHPAAQPPSGDVKNGPSATASPVPPPPFDLWGPRRPSPLPSHRPHQPERIFIPQPLSNINPSVPPTRYPAHIVIPQNPSTASGANQSSAGPTNQQLAIESAPRRPRPLTRNYERLFVDSNGNLEVRDYRTPEYLERMAETERVIRIGLQDTQHLVYDSILRRCKERMPAMYYNEEDEELYYLF